MNTGHAARTLLRKVLVIAVAVLILDRLGYAIGTLISRISP